MDFAWRMIWNVMPGLQFLLIAYSFCSNLDFRVGNEKFTSIAWVVNFTQRSVLKVIPRVQLLHISTRFARSFEHESTGGTCHSTNAMHGLFDL